MFCAISSENVAPAPLYPRRDDVIDQLAVDWLPDEVKKGIEGQDPSRFENAVMAVEEVAKKAHDVEAFHRHRLAVVEAEDLLTQVQGFFRTQRMIELRAVQRFYNATFHLAMVSEEDWDVHYQWLAAGTGVLSNYANEFRLAGMQLDWTVYWDLLERKRKIAATSSADSNVSLSMYKEAFNHCKKARTLFPPASMEAIWNRLLPQLEQTLSPISLRALILLLIFFPFKAAPAAADLPVHAIADKAIQLWLSVSMNTFWDRLWLRFLARLAKWDTHARIDWQLLLRPVCAYAMHLLRVPLQGTQPPAATVITPPDLPSASIIDRVCSHERSCAEHLGKLLVQAVPAGAPAAPAAPGGLPAAAALQQFTTLLEHYYHAPNAGKWSKGLAEYIDACITQLVVHRVPWEATAHWAGDASRRRLEPAAAASVAESLWPLAKLAVFHKDPNLQAAGLEGVANLAFVLPERALPFVVHTFRETLASAEAVHQIETAIALLSECVRPMLLYGLPPDDEPPGDGAAVPADDGMTSQQRAAAAVGAALEALVPALDANDDGKLRAAVAFFNSTFCSVVALRSDDPCAALPRSAEAAPGGAGADAAEGGGGGEGLPVGIDLQYWAVEVVERLMEVARTLQAHEGAGGGDDGDGGNSAASWLGRHCIFTLFCAQFFQKLPAAAGAAAFERVCRLALDLQDAAAVRAMQQLVHRGCAALPGAAATGLLAPLLRQLREHAAAQPGTDVNSSHVTWVCTKATLLVHVVQGLGEAMELEAHADDLMEVVLKVSQTSSPALNDVAGSVLAATLLELTSPRLRLDAVPHTTLPGCPGVAAWLPGRGSAAPRPRWRAPPPSAHAAARALALRAAAEAAAAVAALTAQGRLDSAEPAARQALHRALILAFAVSEGLLAAAEPPLLSAEAAAARDADAAHALTVSMPPVSDAWRDCSFYREALDLAMVVLEKASESGTTNATVALSLIELSVPVTHTLDLSTDHPGYDLVREEAYRGFYEPPLADSLRGAAVATGGSGFRCAPAVAAARADSLMHVRRYYAVAGARATAGHLHPCMHELYAQLLGAAAAAAKAVRHRYPGVSVDAVEVFQAALAAQCKGLLDGALPGVVAALGLLEGSRGGWVLSAEGGVDEKLQAASEKLLGVLGTDWQTKGPAVAAAGAHAAGASQPASPDGSSPPSACASPEAAASDMEVVVVEEVVAGGRSPAQETSASKAAADLALLHGSTVAAVPAGGGSAAATPAASPLQAGTPAGDARPAAAVGGTSHTQVRRSLRRLSLPQTAEAGGAGRGGLRASATLGSADGAETWEEEILAEASVASVALEEEEEEEGAQACTEANQHIVAGALDFVEQSRSTLLPQLLRRRPEAARALLLAMAVALRYDTRDVKPMVTATLPVVVQLLERRVGDAPGTFRNVALFGDVAAALCSRLARGRLHWREALLAQLLCMHLLPLAAAGAGEDAGGHSAQQGRLEGLLGAQVHGLFRGTSLLCKNAAMMALVDASLRASATAAPPALAAACRAAVAACGADAPDFPETLLSTLIAVKAANFDEMVMAAMSEATMVASSCGITVDTACDTELALFTLVPPSVDSAAGDGDAEGGGGGPGESLRMAVVHFVAFLVQHDAAGAGAVVPRLRARIEAWAVAPQKDRMADGSVEKLLEVVVVECCLGVLLGMLRRGPAMPAAGADGAGGGDCSEAVEWAIGMLRAGYAAAPTEKGNVWAYAVAVAARIAANASLTHAAAGNAAAAAAATSALQAVMRTLRELVGSWSGSTSTDTRHACALAYVIDELLQAGAASAAGESGGSTGGQGTADAGGGVGAAGTPPGIFSQHSGAAGAQRMLREGCGAARALAEALQMVVDAVPRAATHALQTVRTAGALMAASAAAALSAPCLAPSARSAADPASLASQLHAALAARLDAADAALPAACATDAAAAAAGGPSAGELERAIGFAAALASSCRHVHLGAPALEALQLRLLPWALRAQAVTHPELQPLMAAVRRTRKLPPLSLGAARALLPQVVAAAEHAHWQVRFSAVQTLQPLWYRHYFAFSPEDVQILIEAAAARLRDAKVEVRAAARRLLAGLLQCAPPATAAAFRTRAHADFAAAFPRPGSRKRRRDGDSAAAAAPPHSVTEQHACALALSAVCASSPYVIAEWTGDAIIALARAAQAPAPVKTAALEALAEFRKNLEGTSRQPLRERLEGPVWDALRDSALQSSYFA